ncbi:MAG: malonyl-CoA synthase [Hyphomicrobiales bacterium]|nr:malonyl-CoA synthase [Hyphomicrobiales bacterium]
MNNSDHENLFSRIADNISNQQAPFVFGQHGGVYSYADMLERSAQYSNVLTNLGLGPGDRLAVQVEKSIDALFLYLGCIRAGGVYLPLNTGYRDKEVEYFIGDANPVIFVCSQTRRPALEEIAKTNGVSHLETLEETAGSLSLKADNADVLFDDVHRSGDDLAAILYTSGTTGRSKGAMLSHDNLYSNARVLVDYWKFTSQDILLHVLPIYHTHGLFVAFNTTLLSGASMIFQEQFKVEDVLSELPKATVMMGVPTLYTRLLSASGFDKALVKQMRLFVSGSAPLSPQTHRDFAERTGHTILERYGMTETNMNTSNPYDGRRKAGTVGLPLPGVEIRITDQITGKRVKSGEVGMIEIRGPNVFKGYWQMPEKTTKEFRNDGFFISGDLGRIDEDGYISIVGRDKDLIISGGFNVYPAEVENAIDALDGIEDVAVIGVPHYDFGEGVTAIVVAANVSAPGADEIKCQLSEVLAKYKMPKEIIFVDALPRNKMGKVQKNELRNTYREIYVVPQP